ncbi:hypothetical protein BJ170DRAFT_593085 [Xylariales sp. AK1849]|nr:hypothetical protein BJ170DRAFT_593085 [Xylariales sp. AK1849]
MDGFFSGSPLDGDDEDDDVLSGGFLMADSQISNLDLSSPEPESQQSPPPRTKSASDRRRPRPPPSSSSSSSSSSSTRRRPDCVDAHRNTQSWEADAVAIDSRRVPRHPHEAQQDLAERIGSLTQTINANAAFCLEVSGKMMALARENKHLYDASRSTLDAYVLQPCLRLPAVLRTYYPGIQDGLQNGLDLLIEYEAQLRRAAENCANGREMARAQGVGGAEGGVRREVSRLKDRLVEQDTLLRDSSQHVQRLIREREALKKQLEAKEETPPEKLDLLGLGMEEEEEDARPLDMDVTGPTEDSRHLGGKKCTAALSDQIRELRVLVDQLALHQASNHERQNSTTKDDNVGDGYDGDDEEPDWTLL